MYNTIMIEPAQRLKYLAPVVALALIALGSASAFVIGQRSDRQTAAINAPEDPKAAFASEIYEIIKKDYWDKITDEQLGTLFKLAKEKAGSDDAVKIADIVLANLKPFGRSRLYSKQQETALRQQVENINPEKDLYAALGVPKGASIDEVEKAFQSKPKTEESAYAHEVLAKPTTKLNYDKGGNEPTVFGKMLKPSIAYMHVKQFAPLTLSEFKTVSDELALKKPSMLILDLRNNIGGAVDFFQYFLGPFIGPDQYAYEFFHQGDKTPYKTKTGWLDSFSIYRQVVVLVDETSQSSAEVTATALKKYRFGVLVGTPTKGHGTIEELFPVKSDIGDGKTYSVLLVQSITLRADSLPIESRGEDPNININDKDWREQLLSYYNSEALIKVVSEVWASP